MGRGRSKAKAKKVARDLKYTNDGVDFDSLAEELHKEVKKNLNKGRGKPTNESKGNE